jgi:hypothetical protein
MDEGKPTEQLVRNLGGKIYVVDPSVQTLPDVVVSDRAAAHRLQVCIIIFPEHRSPIVV